MATIKPTFTLTSNKASATTTPGPLSVALALSVTDSLTVDTVQSEIISVTDTRALILDGSGIHGATTSMDPGTDGGYLYLKNTGTAKNCHVGIVAPAHASNDPATPATDGATSSLDGTTQETLRTFTLKPGEFAFLPWDYTGDIWVEANHSDGTTLEYWLFDRG